MSAEEWRYAVASAVGTSHASRELPCQDACACQVVDDADGAPVFVAVGADGAGSAARAEEGARIACSTLLDEIITFYAAGCDLADLDRELFGWWLAGLRDDVARLAEADGLALRDYACTILVAVVESERAAFVQIGDGAIVTSDRSTPDCFAPVFWPERGEYANQTRFVTDRDATEHVAFVRRDEAIDEVALFTDGLQALALHYASQSAYAPFFRPIFVPVRREPPGRSDRLSAALAGFLASPPVNRRTDDDKTLILATRREQSFGDAAR